MGRHGKKKAKMMMMMPQMMMMMPQCQQDDSSDSDEKTPHATGQGSAGSEARNQQRRSPRRPGAYIKNELAEIHKSATCVRNFPRAKISESPEALHETLDSTMTSELGLDGLLTCLWIFTRVKPNQRVCDLRH